MRLPQVPVSRLQLVQLALQRRDVFLFAVAEGALRGAVLRAATLQGVGVLAIGWSVGKLVWGAGVVEWGEGAHHVHA